MTEIFSIFTHMFHLLQSSFGLPLIARMIRTDVVAKLRIYFWPPEAKIYLLFCLSVLLMTHNDKIVFQLLLQNSEFALVVLDSHSHSLLLGGAGEVFSDVFLLINKRRKGKGGSLKEKTGLAA